MIIQSYVSLETAIIIGVRNSSSQKLVEKNHKYSNLKLYTKIINKDKTLW